MPIVNAGGGVAERGKSDAKRHREKQREAIRKRLPEIISEESIITKSGKGRTIRIPIRQIQIPIFRHGSGKNGQGKGIGQGDGKKGKGDEIGRRPGPGGKPGQAGSEPGVDYIENEIAIDEIIEMMFEDIGLPRLEDKDVRKIVVELGFRIRGTQRTGPHVLLNKKKTAKEGIRRFWNMLRALEKESGKDELTCYRAIVQAECIFEEAVKLLQESSVTRTDEKVKPFPILHTDDLRFHKIERSTSLQSQAVVFLNRDASWSMDEEKVYLAKAMCYWLVTFLRQVYEHVEIRFIMHDTRAKLVDEEEFSRIDSFQGGTQCSSAYELVDSLIDSEYPLSQYNAYAFHFSDGDDFNPERSASAARKLIDKGINAFGYCEIRPGDSPNARSSLVRHFGREFGLIDKQEGSVSVSVCSDVEVPFIGIHLRQKEDLLPALKAFLKQDRWVKS
jgi:uncharacterized protein